MSDFDIASESCEGPGGARAGMVGLRPSMGPDWRADMGLEPPPVPPELASDLYGHLAEPVSGGTIAEIDAQAEAKKQAVAKAVEAKTAQVEAAVPAPAEEKKAPPTKASLDADLDAAQAKEERELDESRAKALGDIDAKIEEQRVKLDAGVLDADATAAQEGALDAQAAEHTAAIQKRSDDDSAARNVRGSEIGMAAREKARAAGQALIGDAESKAKDIRARGVADAEKIRGEGETRLAFFQTQADQHQADGNTVGMIDAMQHKVAVATDIGQRMKGAIEGANKAGDLLVQNAKSEALRLESEAEGTGGKPSGGLAGMVAQGVASGIGASSVDEQHKAGVDKLHADTDATRGKQRDKAAATLADLQKQKEAMIARLDAQIAAKRKAIAARIAGLRKQVASAGPGALAQIDAGVAEIDKASDQIDAGASSEIGALGQRAKSQTEQTLAVMNAEGRAALARIDADAKVARAAIENAGKNALARASDAGKSASESQEAAAAKAAEEQDKKIADAQKHMAEVAGAQEEAGLRAGMTPAQREVHKEEVAGRAQLKAGKSRSDLQAALARIPADKRDAAIAELPEEQQALARQALEVQAGGEAMRAALARGESVDAMLTGSVADRNALLRAAGPDAKKLIDPKLLELTSDEAEAAAAAVKGGNDGVLADLTPEQRAQLDELYRAKNGGHSLEDDVQGRQMIAGAQSPQQIAEGLAKLSPDQRADAIAKLPPEIQGLGQKLLENQTAGDELKAKIHEPEEVEKLLAGKSPAERNAIIVASGAGDELEGKYTKLSDEETAAGVKALAARSPAAVKASFAGLTPEQQQQLGDAYQKETGRRLEDDVPPANLPNDVLSPQAIAGKLKPGDDKALHRWLAELPADKRDAAIAELPDADRATARHTLAAQAEGEKLKEAMKATDPKEQAKAVDALLEGKSAAERNAILKESGISGGAVAKHAALSGEEKRLAVEALLAAQADPGKLAAIFEGLTPEQAASISGEYEAKTMHKPEEDLPIDLLPAGALSWKAQFERNPDDIAAVASAMPASGDPVKDAASLHEGLMELPVEKRNEVIASLPPAQKKQAMLMARHETDAEALKKALSAENVDPAAVDDILAGWPPAERRAIIAASGSADKLPDAKKYTELSEEEKSAAATELYCAQVGGVVDKEAVAATMDDLDPDQQKQVGREFKEVSGVRVGEAFKSCQELLPETLREKEPNVKDLKEASKALFEAMDGSGTDEGKILDTLRGKSPAEIRELKRIYREQHQGHDLMEDLREDLSDEELEAAEAMVSDDPVRAAVASMEYGRRGSGTDEQLIKDTLASLTDPEDRAAVEKLWKERHPDESLEEMLRNEMHESGTDYQESEALLQGDPDKARAVRAYDAMDGAGTNEEKLNQQLEACPDEKSRRKLREEFRKIAIANGEPPELWDLDAAIADEESGPDRDVSTHLANGELAEAYASKLEVAGKGWGTDEKAMFDIFENPPPGWKGSKESWRKEVEKKHDAEYAGREGGMTTRELGEDELSEMDQKRFTQTVDKGEMDFAFAMTYATKGSGTKDEILDKYLHNEDGDYLTKEQLDERRRRYREATGEDLDELIDEETSGRVGFDLKDALKGEPLTPEEKVIRMHERVGFENSGILSGVGNLFTESDECMEAQLALADKAYTELRTAETPEEQKAAEEKFAETEGYLKDNVSEHRDAMDKIAETAGQIVSTVGSLYNPLGAFMMALESKYALKGNAMSVEEIEQEFAVGAVTSGIQAAFTVATGGAGAPAAGFLEEMLLGMAQNGLSSLAGEVLDPRFLAGEKGLDEVLGNVALSVGTGALGSKLGEGFGELGKALGLGRLGAMAGSVADNALQNVLPAAVKGEDIDGLGLALGSLTSAIDSGFKHKEEIQHAELDLTTEPHGPEGRARGGGDHDEPALRAHEEKQPEHALPRHDDGPEVHARTLSGAELGELHADIAGAENTAHMKERARDAADKLSPDDRAEYEKLCSSAKSNLAKEMIERSLAAGNPVELVAGMAAKIDGLGDAQLHDLLTGKGGIVQVSADSCVPASLQIAIAQVDPVFALRMAESPEMMALAQWGAMKRADSDFSMRDDLSRLPRELQEAIARNPRLGEVLSDRTYYDRDTGAGMGADDVRATPLKRKLEQTSGTETFVGEQHSFDHDKIREQLDHTGAVPFAANGHGQTITGHYTDERGELCYVVRDPQGDTRVVIAAALDEMDGVYVVHERSRDGRISDEEWQDITARKPGDPASLEGPDLTAPIDRDNLSPMPEISKEDARRLVPPPETEDEKYRRLLAEKGDWRTPIGAEELPEGLTHRPTSVEREGAHAKDFGEGTFNMADTLAADGIRSGQGIDPAVSGAKEWGDKYNVAKGIFELVTKGGNIKPKDLGDALLSGLGMMVGPLVEMKFPGMGDSAAAMSDYVKALVVTAMPDVAEQVGFHVKKGAAKVDDFTDDMIDGARDLAKILGIGDGHKLRVEAPQPEPEPQQKVRIATDDATGEVDHHAELELQAQEEAAAPPRREERKARGSAPSDSSELVSVEEARRTGKKASTPEEALLAGGMTPHEMELYKESLGGDQQSMLAHEELAKMGDAQRLDVMPSHDQNVDGSPRAPLTDEQKAAVLKANILLYGDFAEGETITKVIPERKIGELLLGKGVRDPMLTGDVGLARNTEGLTAREKCSYLGLDYADNPYTQGDPGAHSVKHDVGLRLFQVDKKISQVELERAKVVLGADLYDYAAAEAKRFKARKDPDPTVEIPRLLELDESGKLKNVADPRVREDGKSPSTGMGYTASMNLRDENGDQYFRPNQELSLARPVPYAQGDELATIDDRGVRKVIATWDEETRSFKLSAGLTQAEIEDYTGNIEAQKHDLAVQARVKEIVAANPNLSKEDAFRRARRDVLLDHANFGEDEQAQRAGALDHYAG